MAHKRAMTGLVAALAGLALVITGCSAHPGAAMRIGDRDISEDAVTEIVTAVPEYLGQQISRANTLQALAAAHYQIRLGQSHDITFSDDQVLDQLKQAAAMQGKEIPDTLPEGLVDIFRGQMVIQQLQVTGADSQSLQDEFNKLVAQEPTQYNPRYITAAANPEQAPAFADIVTPASLKAAQNNGGNAPTDPGSQSGQTH